MKALLFVYVFIIMILFCSCENNKVGNLKQFIGKTISFSCIKQLDERNLSSFIKQNSNKIIVYLDSVDCTPCALDNVIMWKTYKNELKRMNLDIILFCNREVPNDIGIYMKSMGLDFPVLTVDESFGKQYSFVEHKQFRTLVVDSENKIIWIGSPIYNEESWDHFRKMMNLIEEGKSK